MRARRSVPHGVLAACLAAIALAGFVTTKVSAAQEAGAATRSPETPAGAWDPSKLGEITLEKIPALHVVSRTVVVGFDKTNEVFVDLKMATLKQINKQGLFPKSDPNELKFGANHRVAAGGSASSLATSQDCVASYAVDPDSTSTSSAGANEEAVPGPPPAVEWTAHIPVPPGFVAPSTKDSQLTVKDAGPYEVGDLPATLAATMFSTVGRAATDGLKFFVWMAENGYVQTGPTRMVYYQKGGTRVAMAEMLNASQPMINLQETKIIVPVKKRDRGNALNPAAAAAVISPVEHQN
jgi:hypothetical protein